MKAHIVGGGFGGLAAAALLIRNAHVPGEDIAIYEADDRMGGGFFLGGSAPQGYSLPGSVFDAEYRCTFDLLAAIPSARNPAISVKDEFYTFNERHPFRDRVHIIDRNGAIVQHSPHFGLSLRDRFALARLSLTPETWLDGRRIEEFFSPQFFSTEFWLLFSTIMGSLPQHCAMELRRYLNRKVGLLPGRLGMSHILRAPFNQYQAFVEPLVAWLLPHGVNLLTGTFVQDIGFAPLPGRITVNRLDYERGGAASSVAVAPEDIVLVTTGSQAADLSTGSMTEAPKPQDTGRSWALWKRLAKEHKGFGNPDAFFGAGRIADSRWVTFTVTTTGTEFMDQMTALTRSEPGTGGLLTLKDSSWVLSLSISHQPEILDQPQGTSVLRGYGLYPERAGTFVRKRMDQCTGEEILKELLQHLRFEKSDAIMKSSICIPCNMPYVNNTWLMRKRGDRPLVVPEGATNLGLIGQYVEVPQEIGFTIEYSTRTAWQAVHTLLKRGPAPPPVYQKMALHAFIPTEWALPPSPAAAPPPAPAPGERLPPTPTTTLADARTYPLPSGVVALQRKIARYDGKPVHVATPPLPAAQGATEVVDAVAFAPPRVARGETFLVQVFLGRTETDEEPVRIAALAADPSAAKRAIATLDVELAVGDRIDIRLEAPGLSVADADQALIWRGRPRSCAFFVTVPNDFAADHVVIQARLYRQAVPVGRIAFSTPIVAAAASEPPTPVGDLSRVYRRAFLSYASPDRPEVIRRAQALRAANIDFFVDLLSLEPGERWERRLYEEIDRCDLFILFWSTPAKNSEWVGKEISYALERIRKQGSSDTAMPEIYPILIEGPPPPKPPDLLAFLQFNDPLLYVIASIDKLSAARPAK